MSPSRYGLWLGVLLGAGIGAVYFLAETEPEKAVSPASPLPVAALSSAPFMPPQLLEKRPTMAEDPTRSPPQSFSDGNRSALFQFALDELHVRDTDGNGRVIRIPPVRDLAGLRSAARAWEATEQRPADPVLYPAGLPRGDFTRRLLTRRVVIETKNGFSGVLPAQALRIETPSYSPLHRIITVAGPLDSLDVADALASHPGVVHSAPLLAAWRESKAIPNDTLIGQQWHLRNTGQSGGTSGIDADVSPIWGTFGGTGFRGSGIDIAIVDGGLQTDHPDFAGNINTTLDYDWNDATPNDPSPGSSTDNHGTACGGLAAARGNNSLGVSGAAPEAGLIGFRLIAGAIDASDIADAFTKSQDVIEIKSNSWGSEDGGGFYGLDPLEANALSAATTSGRGGKGTIFTFASGNGRDFGDYANADGYPNSRFGIAVGAVDHNGAASYYSEAGACVLICGPSGGNTGNIVTTDRTSTAGYNTASGTAGNYTTTFSGTSAATPVVSGVCALLLQANSALGWRDVKEILLRSAVKVQPSDTGWVTNGAGFPFNHQFGAGLVNAEAAANLASSWTNLRAETSSTQVQTVTRSIPDNNATGVLYSVSFTPRLRVEHVEASVEMAHDYLGDIECILTSPSGHQSTLLAPRPWDGTAVFRQFHLLTSVQHWGEKAGGTWTVRVADRGAADTGAVYSVAVKLCGTTYTTGIDIWRYDNFTATELSNSTVSGNAADPDNDGLNNFVEYALGGNPKTHSLTPWPVASVSGSLLTLTYNRPRADVTYTVETSTTLEPGSWTTTGVNQGTGNPRTASITMDVPKRFLRLRMQ
jgi:subtilisin family serine protease